MTSVGAAVIMFYQGLSWAWDLHNQVLYDALRPVLRASLAQRINNYRKKECMGDYSSTNDLEEALADYESLMGRPIRDRSCDSL